MNRREFLKSLAACTAVAALPVAAVDALASEWELSGLIEGRTFYLTRTLKLLPHVIIRNCQFKTVSEFDGPMIQVIDQAIVIHSIFRDRRKIRQCMIQIGGRSPSHLDGCNFWASPCHPLTVS